MDPTSYFLATKQVGQGRSSGRRGRQMERSILPSVSIQDMASKGYKLGMACQIPACAMDSGLLPARSGFQDETLRSNGMTLQMPFVHGIVESFDSRESSIGPVQDGVMVSCANLVSPIVLARWVA
jgi:hypothetical protein